MMRKHALALLSLVLVSPLWAPVSSKLNIEETDGTPSTFPWKLKVTAGSLIDNGDGTATLSTGAGGGGGTSGQINTSTKNSVGYYSVTGSSNVISGLAPGTSGYVLATAGDLLTPYWTLQTGGGSGSSTLAVATGTSSGFTGVPTSSPTAVLLFDTATTDGQLLTSTTYFFKLKSSSVTLQGNTLGGDVTGTLGSMIVGDDSHAHTSSSISGLDISADTNLTVEAPILLVGDEVRIDKSSATLLGPSITLGSETEGNYVRSVAVSAPLTGGQAAAEDVAIALDIDRSSFTLLGPSIDAGLELTGTLAAAQFPAMTGDVTNTAGSLTTAVGDDSHAHTGSTLSGIDISNDTNLSATNGIILSGDVVSVSSVSLSTQVIGNLPVTNLNSGTGATSSTFWRGDGTWVSSGTFGGGSGDMILASTQTVTGAKINTSSTTFYGAVVISTTVILNGSTGTNGQVFTSGGQGSLVTWTTLSGAALASTQTWTGGNTYQSSSTFTGAVLVSTTIILGGSTGNSGQALLSGGQGSAASWGTPVTTRTYVYDVAGLQALETNFAPVESTNTASTIFLARAFDDTTREYANGFFTAPSNILNTGTITIRLNGRSKTAAATRNTGWFLEHLPLMNGENLNTAYKVSASSGIAVSATQGVLDQLSWTMSVSSSTWAANDAVFFKLSRDPSAISDLTGDYYLKSLSIDVPVQ